MAGLLIPANFISEEMETELTEHKDAPHYFPRATVTTLLCQCLKAFQLYSIPLKVK